MGAQAKTRSTIGGGQFYGLACNYNSYTYDAMGRLTQIRDQGRSFTATITNDWNGNITEVTEVIPGTMNVTSTFAYDNENRLTEFTIGLSGFSAEHTYDGFNRLIKTDATVLGNTTNYEHTYAGKKHLGNIDVTNQQQPVNGKVWRWGVGFGRKGRVAQEPVEAPQWSSASAGQYYNLADDRVMARRSYQAGAVVAGDTTDQSDYAEWQHVNGAAVPTRVQIGVPSELFSAYNITLDADRASSPNTSYALQLGATDLEYEVTRVKSPVVGRDLNPLGRGDGTYYPNGGRGGGGGKCACVNLSGDRHPCDDNPACKKKGAFSKRSDNLWAGCICCLCFTPMGAPFEGDIHPCCIPCQLAYDTGEPPPDFGGGESSGSGRAYFRYTPPSPREDASGLIPTGPPSDPDPGFHDIVSPMMHLSPQGLWDLFRQSCNVVNLSIWNVPVVASGTTALKSAGNLAATVTQYGSAVQTDDAEKKFIRELKEEAGIGGEALTEEMDYWSRLIAALCTLGWEGLFKPPAWLVWIAALFAVVVYVLYLYGRYKAGELIGKAIGMYVLYAFGAAVGGFFGIILGVLGIVAAVVFIYYARDEITQLFKEAQERMSNW